MASIRKYSIILILMSLISLGSSDTGIGTINDPPYLPSACYGFQDQGVMIAAANEDLWDDGAACGKFFQVTCTGGTNQGTPHPCTDNPTVTVMITDFCPPPGCQGDLDLSREAFSARFHTKRFEEEEKKLQKLHSIQKVFDDFTWDRDVGPPLHFQ